jgi:hypothetical protein
MNDENKESDIPIPIDIKIINWSSVAKLVIKKIHYELRKMAGLAAGTTELDLFQIVMVKFLDSPNHLGWDPTKIRKELTLEEGLANFLIGVAVRTMAELQRSIARRHLVPPSADEAGKSRGNDNEPPFLVNQPARQVDERDCDLIASELQRDLISLVPDDAVAIGVIKAAADTTGGGKVDIELALLLFGDESAAAVRQIVNAKKRIRRAVKKKERYLKWTNKPKTTALHARAISPNLQRSTTAPAVSAKG